MQVPFQIDITGTSILGMLHIPPKRLSKSPVLLMCYGFNGNRVEQHRMSKFLGEKAEEKGICLVRFDYRGQGISDGEFSQVTLKNRMEDISIISKFIEGCFQGEEYSLIPVGFSDGAKLVATVADELSNVYATCMWSPIFFQNKVFFEGKNNFRFTKDPITGNLVYPVYGLWVNANYLREMNSHSSFERFCQNQYPKLCIFGSEDELVKDTIVQLSNNDTTFKPQIVYIKNAGHVFSRNEWAEEVIDKTLQWVINLYKE